MFYSSLRGELVGKARGCAVFAKELALLRVLVNVGSLLLV
jgi:hypothetical protein